jgi:hypothetical protein
MGMSVVVMAAAALKAIQYIGKSIIDSLHKILVWLDKFDKRFEWLDKLQEQYPDAGAVIDKLKKLNGFDKK